LKKRLLQIQDVAGGSQGLAFCIIHSTLVLLFLLIIFEPFHFSAYGFDDDMVVKWWKNQKIVDELELTNSQVDQIEDVFSSHKNKMLELRSKLRKKDEELSKKASNPNSTREEILQLTDEVENIKGELRDIRVDMLLRIRDVLSPQQRGKLQEIQERYGKPY
jgi:Spy/CpxP family protein refolding chaperone